MVVLLNIQGKCAHLRAKTVDISGHLPIASPLELEQNDLLEAIKVRPQMNVVVNGFTDWRFAMMDLSEM
jgi:hypothetical protein